MVNSIIRARLQIVDMERSKLIEMCANALALSPNTVKTRLSIFRSGYVTIPTRRTGDELSVFLYALGVHPDDQVIDKLSTNSYFRYPPIEYRTKIIDEIKKSINLLLSNLFFL